MFEWFIESRSCCCEFNQSEILCNDDFYGEFRPLSDMEQIMRLRLTTGSFAIAGEQLGWWIFNKLLLLIQHFIFFSILRGELVMSIKFNFLVSFEDILFLGLHENDSWKKHVWCCKWSFWTLLKMIMEKNKKKHLKVYWQLYFVQYVNYNLKVLIQLAFVVRSSHIFFQISLQYRAI